MQHTHRSDSRQSKQMLFMHVCIRCVMHWYYSINWDLSATHLFSHSCPPSSYSFFLLSLSISLSISFFLSFYSLHMNTEFLIHSIFCSVPLTYTHLALWILCCQIACFMEFSFMTVFFCTENFHTVPSSLCLKHEDVGF